MEQPNLYPVTKVDLPPYPGPPATKGLFYFTYAISKNCIYSAQHTFFSQCSHLYSQWELYLFGPTYFLLSVFACVQFMRIVFHQPNILSSLSVHMCALTKNCISSSLTYFLLSVFTCMQSVRTVFYPALHTFFFQCSHVCSQSELYSIQPNILSFLIVQKCVINNKCPHVNLAHIQSGSEHSNIYSE